MIVRRSAARSLLTAGALLVSFAGMASAQPAPATSAPPEPAPPATAPSAQAAPPVAPPARLDRARRNPAVTARRRPRQLGGGIAVAALRAPFLPWPVRAEPYWRR